MKNAVKIELKKAIKTRYFFITVVIGILITMLSLVYNIQIIQQAEENIYEGYNPCYEGYTLFNHWVGGEAYSLGSSLYYFVFPILIAIPYGWSYCGEQTSGYIRQVVVRMGRKKYMLAKYIATFISGGLTMIIPLVINFMLTALFFPAIKPVVSYDTMYGVFGYSMFSELYYTYPFVYVAIYLLLDFLFCGALTGLTMISAKYIKYKWVNCIFPFITCMIINLAGSLFISNAKQNYEISPFYFLRPAEAKYPANLSLILIMMCSIILITIIYSWIVERKNEFL